MDVLWNLKSLVYIDYLWKYFSICFNYGIWNWGCVLCVALLFMIGNTYFLSSHCFNCDLACAWRKNYSFQCDWIFGISIIIACRLIFQFQLFISKQPLWLCLCKLHQLLVIFRLWLFVKSNVMILGLLCTLQKLRWDFWFRRFHYLSIW